MSAESDTLLVQSARAAKAVYAAKQRLIKALNNAAAKGVPCAAVVYGRKKDSRVLVPSPVRRAAESAPGAARAGIDALKEAGALMTVGLRFGMNQHATAGSPQQKAGLVQIPVKICTKVSSPASGIKLQPQSAKGVAALARAERLHVFRREQLAKMLALVTGQAAGSFNGTAADLISAIKAAVARDEGESVRGCVCSRRGMCNACIHAWVACLLAPPTIF